MTKTVMGVLCVAFLAGYVATIVLDHSRSGKRRALAVMALLLAFLAPVIAVETWRFFSLGDATSYIHWWKTELPAVGRQAGLIEGHGDTTHLANKISTHLQLLGEMYHLHQVALVAWLLGPLVLGGALVLRNGVRRDQLPFLLPMIAATLYFVWWIAVTPTQKAWHRRILDGSLLLNYSWAYISIWCLQTSARRTMAWRYASLLPVLAVIGASAYFLVSAARTELSEPTNTRRIIAAADVVRSLPRDSIVTGIGWNSAPTISLLSQRPFLDFNNLVYSRLPDRKGLYVVAEKNMPQSKLDRVLTTYRHSPLLDSPDGVRIYRILLASPAIEPSALAGAPYSIDLSAGDSRYIAGFYPADSGSRWMPPDVFVILNHPRNGTLGIDMFIPKIEIYDRDNIALRVSINDCEVGVYGIQRKGMHKVRLKVPDNCMASEGTAVRVRLSANAVIDSAITIDDRALFAKASMVGFVDERGHYIETPPTPRAAKD